MMLLGVLFLVDNGAVVLEDGGADVILLALLILLSFACIPVLHGTVVAGDAAVYLGSLAALGAGELLAVEVAVVLADGIG